MGRAKLLQRYSAVQGGVADLGRLGVGQQESIGAVPNRDRRALEDLAQPCSSVKATSGTNGGTGDVAEQFLQRSLGDDAAVG